MSPKKRPPRELRVSRQEEGPARMGAVGKEQVRCSTGGCELMAERPLPMTSGLRRPLTDCCACVSASSRERPARRASGVHRRCLEDHVRGRLERAPRECRLRPAGLSKVLTARGPPARGENTHRDDEEAGLRVSRALTPASPPTLHLHGATGACSRSRRKWHVWGVSAPGQTYMQTCNKGLWSRRSDPASSGHSCRAASCHPPRGPGGHVSIHAHFLRSPGEHSAKTQQLGEKAVTVFCRV